MRFTSTAKSNRNSSNSFTSFTVLEHVIINLVKPFNQPFYEFKLFEIELTYIIFIKPVSYHFVIYISDNKYKNYETNFNYGFKKWV